MNRPNLPNPLWAVQRAKWSINAWRARPVFIVGEARSGTSLLYRMLQRHPSFHPAAGLHLVESHAMELLPGTVHDGEPAPWSLVTFTFGQDPYDQFIADVSHLRRRRNLFHRAPFNQSRLRLLAWWFAGEHHVVRRYFLGSLQARGATRLLEKTPGHIAWVRHMQIAFPRARFVYITRHPVEVYASYRRRAESDSDAKWADIAVEDFCARWRQNLDAALAYERRRTPPFMIIRYDDLTSKPEATLRKLLSFLGEEFDRECLMTPQPNHDWEIDPLLFKDVDADRGRWRAWVDTDVASALEDRLADRINMAGLRPLEKH